MIGQTLSHYRITAKLGEGGMGEVYLAEDSKLGREVALKVLPPDLAADAERLHRFEREAQAIAALNHPNIVTIYSVEEASGPEGPVYLLTMERVDGESLDRILPAGGFDLERLLGLGAQIADALAAAHDKGIIHRDLKPANVMVTGEDRVKILDFGLAKLAESEEGDEATELLTQAGMVLGTVPYMSPEQVQAQPVDHRSDIFSLGILLYEMATGTRPFRGENPASVISSVLKDQPPLVTEVKSELPNHLGRIVRRCLEKQSHKRYQSARDVQLELEGLERESASGSQSTVSRASVTAPSATLRQPRVWLLPAAGAFLLGAVISYLVLTEGGKEAADRVADTATRALTQITDLTGTEAFPSLSPDGKQIVYASTRDGHTDIHLLRIGGENPINLTRGSAAVDTHPAFSPDGDSIAFRSDRQGGGLFLMGATGESVRRLTDFGYHPAWSPDGTRIAFSTDEITEPAIRTTRSTTWIVDIASGATRVVVETDASQPTWSPDGEWLAYWGLIEGSGQRDLFVVPAAGGEPVNLTNDAHMDWNPIWSPNGSFLYFASDRGGSRDLWRLPMNSRTGRPSGSPQPMTLGAAGIDHLAIAASGERLAFVSRFRRDRVERMTFDPLSETILSPSETVIESSARVNMVWLSRDDQWLLWWAGRKQDALLVERLDGTDRRVLIRDEFRNRTPSWCAAEQKVLFSSDRDGVYEIWSIGADGSGLEQVTDGSSRPGGAMVPLCADAKGLLFYTKMGIATTMARFENGKVSEERHLPSPDGDGYAVFWDLSGDHNMLSGSIWHEGVATGLAVFDIDRETYQVAPFPRGVSLGTAASRWLSDNRRVVFGLDNTLTIFDSATGEQRTIAGSPVGTISLADVSSDDRQLFVIRRLVDEDIWLLDL